MSLHAGSSSASSGASGTVTSVSVATANGVSGSVANPTTTPAITVALGAITPTSVAASGAVSGSNLSGTNTGDNLIGQSAVASSITGTLVETTLATITLPAGAMGANGQIEIEALFTTTNSANNKTVKFKLGASTIFSAIVTTVAQAQYRKRVANRNSASSQVTTNAASASELGTSTVAVATYSENTANSVNITITGTLANTGETITLESYRVLCWPKA